MGWADMLIKMEIAYDSDEAVALGEKVMGFIQAEAQGRIAQARRGAGSFPNFGGSIYDSPDGGPMRNATVTTIAPTGTLSIIANCSVGRRAAVRGLATSAPSWTTIASIEVNPIFEEIAVKRGFYSEELMALIAEHGSVHGIDEVPEDIQRVFVTAHDIAPEWHIRMQAAFQKHTDNAVSKTVNFANEATAEDVRAGLRSGVRARRQGRDDLP